MAHGILVPWPGIEPTPPQQWKLEVFYPLDLQESLRMIFILSSSGPYSSQGDGV